MNKNTQLGRNRRIWFTVTQKKNRELKTKVTGYQVTNEQRRAQYEQDRAQNHELLV